MPVASRRSSGVLPVLTAAFVAALVLGGSPGAAFADDPPPGIPPAGPVFASGPIPIAGTVTLFGRGNGHGVGLSQWGARGRAVAGQDAATILGHYYQNTALAAIDPATAVRVLLVAGFVPTATRPARIVGLNGPWTVDGMIGTFPPGAALDLSRSTTTWQATVTGPDGTVLASDPAPGDLRIRPAAPETLLQVPFKAGSSNVYRGVIRLVAVTRVTAINEVAIDQYLLGVVPVEMSYTWPIEALKAQAVAARTYALKRLHPSVGRWDLYDDTRSQIYRGVNAEKASVTQAVTDTAGLVLMAGAAVANTPYHAADGGATENSEFVWTRPDGTVVNKPCPELRGSSDRAPDGSSYDAGSPFASWRTATYTVERFSSIMAADDRTNVGLVSAIDFARRGVSGRVVSLTLIGTNGTKTVSGGLFQAIFNAHRPAGHPLLRSTLIDLTPIP